MKLNIAHAVLLGLLLNCCQFALAQRPRVQQSSASTSEAPPEAEVVDQQPSKPKQFIEVRTYALVDAAAEEKLDAYLERALIPAFERQGLGPIGALAQADQGDTLEVKLIIPGPTLEAVALASSKLADDAEYQRAAKDYHSTPFDRPLVSRIRSELLIAFDCWPQVTVPSQKNNDRPRYFELRSYESPTEQLGELKVEMFNEGEVPIFLDAGIIPVFMGQALIGDMRPNLTYMVAFDDAQAMTEAWPKFRDHPDWKTLSGNPRYQGTVSKNNKTFWINKSYSRL